MSESALPQVSVVIPSRGGRERLPRLMAALGQQSYPSWEAVIVLDGDIDNSREVIEAHGDARIQVLEFAENRGRTAALNAGFAQARGDILVRCDDDLEPGVDFVARHAAHHTDALQPVGVIGLCRNVFPDTAYARSYGEDADERLRGSGLREVPSERWLFWGGNVSVHRATHERLDGYDERFRQYGYEDVDYGYRLRLAGVPIIIDPELTTPHHVAATTTQIRASRAYFAAVARHTFEGIHGEVFPQGAAAATGTKQWLWQRAVAGLAPLLTYGRAQALAALVDRILPVIPVSVGRKMVALVIEATAVHGARSGQLPQGHSI